MANVHAIMEFAPDVRLVEERHGRFFALGTDLYVGRSLRW